VRRALVVVVAGLMLAGVGCSKRSSRDDWGASAVTLLDDEVAAMSSGDAYDPLRFWAGDLDVDLRVAVPGFADRFPHALGLDRAVMMLEGTRFSANVERVYLDGSAAFTVERWTQPADETVGVLRDVSPEGVDVLRGFLQLVDRGDAFDYRRRELAAELAPMVSAYTAAWSSGDRAAIDALYTPGAAPAGAKTEALTPTGDLSLGEGLYAYAPLGDSLHQAVVMLDRAGPDGCVTQVAQLWDLDGGRIERDTRLLEVSSANRCLPSADRPTGWWVDRPPPVAPEDRLTRTRALAGGADVKLYNSTPDLERLLDWGLGQFAAAGLVPPRPAAVVFAPARACSSTAGGVVEAPAGLRVTVCYTEATACADLACASFTEGAKLFMLHELGHVWALQNLDAAQQDAFVARAGLPGWLAADIPYAQRGAEHAAETIAWGLLGEVHDRYRNLTKPPCARVAELFTVLTGVAPLSSCPP
jgi:hypothetical protein